MPEDIKKEFFLVLESIPDEDIVKSAKIRSIFLTDFGYDLDQAREILENLPHAIAISDDLTTLENIAQVLYGTDAELNIIPVLDEEEVVQVESNEEVKEEINKVVRHEFHPERFLSKRAVTTGNLSVVNISPKKTEAITGVRNSPLFLDIITSIIIAAIVLGFSYIAFYENPNNTTEAKTLQNKISRIQKDLELNKTEVDLPEIKVAKPKLYATTFDIDNINFVLNLSIFNKEIKNINLEASPASLEAAPTGFEKGVLASISYDTHAIDKFILQGIFKLYMTYRGEIQRPTANSYISGEYQPDTDSYKIRLLINRGFEELPGNNILSLVNSDLEATKIFIDKTLELKAN